MAPKAGDKASDDVATTVRIHQDDAQRPMPAAAAAAAASAATTTIEMTETAGTVADVDRYCTDRVLGGLLAGLAPC